MGLSLREIGPPSRCRPADLNFHLVAGEGTHAELDARRSIPSAAPSGEIIGVLNDPGLPAKAKMLARLELKGNPAI